MSEQLESVKGEESAGPLDGVDGAEHMGQQLSRVGRLLKGNKIVVQLVEVLIALDQKLTDDLVHALHP